MNNYFKFLALLLIASPCFGMPNHKKCENSRLNLKHYTMDTQHCETKKPCSTQSYTDKQGCHVSRSYHDLAKDCVTVRWCLKKGIKK